MAHATLISRFRQVVRHARERLGKPLDAESQVRRIDPEASRIDSFMHADSEEQVLDLTADTALDELLAIENGKLVPAPVLSPAKMLEKVEAGFAAIVDLVDGMRESADRQEACQAAQVEVQKKLAQRMSMMPAAVMSTVRMARQNGELLSTLSRRIESQIDSQQSLIDALKVIPQTAAQQSGLLKGIHDQLLLREELDHEMTGSMLNMNETLQQMSATGSAQADALGRLHMAQQDQSDVVQGSLHKQDRRFGWMFGLAIGLCTFVLAGAATIFVMLLQ